MSRKKKYSLNESMGYWVNLLANTMREGFERTLAPYRVTAQQWAVLVSLCNKDAETPTQLARILGLDGSAITRLLDRLEAKGLLVRRPGVSDRRSIKLELTASGRTLTPKLIPLSKEGNRRFMKGLSEREISQFRVTIQRMLKNAPSG